ncbi:hypothetical protein FGK63_14890 [Ruegeria sediminis]|uniref:Uncharacterized protein n=1 Tax=Ruegeria sediminis TaxID=2583820 RepID=A0ABY2WUY8_9RHOB|nr:hypothetical protein [Ruegeria sediminis]TMV06429.1 hypothetical protein FGK63_14890 [Ruegeria sediminis]
MLDSAPQYKIDDTTWWEPDVGKDENGDYSDAFWLWYNHPEHGRDYYGPIFCVDYKNDTPESVAERAKEQGLSEPKVAALKLAFEAEAAR